MIMEFFRFELREQLRSPLLWLLSAMFGLMAFAAASSKSVWRQRKAGIWITSTTSAASRACSAS